MPKFTTIFFTRDKQVQKDVMDYLDDEMQREEPCERRIEYTLDFGELKQMIRVENNMIGLTSGIPEDIRRVIKNIIYEE